MCVNSTREAAEVLHKQTTDEIMGVYLSKANMEMESEEGKGLAMSYSVGDIQGWRRAMEDSHIAQLNVNAVAARELGKLDEKESMSIFGVFDGHGGKEVAKFVQVKFVREFVRSKAFKEQRYSEALRTTFHRIDDMLEDPKYDAVLRKMKILPNPSDAKTVGDSDDEDNFDSGAQVLKLTADNIGKMPKTTGYDKFNPLSSEWDSEDENSKTGGGEGMEELVEVPAQRRAEKKKVTKRQALELFKLLLQETQGPSGAAAKRQQEIKDAQDDDEEEEEEVAQARIPKGEWNAYYLDPNRRPGDKPRPTLHSGPASVPGPSGLACNLRDHRIQAGCTSVVALRVGNLLYCANAGDSRGVMCRGDAQAHALSEDHKPSSSVEIARIEKAGGFVNVNGRINGNLNLSRSIGDMKYKQVGTLLPSEQMITAEPDVTVTEILPTDKFFTLACDGVWDVLSNQEICDFISERLYPTSEALKFTCKNSPFQGVISKALSLTEIVRDVFDYCVAEDPKRTQGIGGDNMTCMIVQLNQ